MLTRSQKNVIFSACIGTLLEWYDFSLYAYLAGLFAKIFFLSLPSIGLLLSYGVFAVGYLARPVGAVLFGYLGDTRGRKKALSLSVLLMAVATCGIGFLPHYSTIGVSAPGLLLFFRLMQGIAVGGEAFGSACFIVESIPSDKTGFFSALIWASSVMGLLLGSFIVFIIFVSFQDDFLYRFGWRFPFFLATISGLVAYYIRAKTAESREFQDLDKHNLIEKFPIKTIFISYKRLLAQLMGLYLLSALITYLVFIFMPVYLTDILGRSKLYVHALNNLLLMLLIVFDIFFGWLSDKYERKYLMLIGASGLLCLSYPLYVMVSQGSLLTMMIAQLIFTVFAASFQGPLMALTLDLIPAAIRFSLGALSYNLAYSFFGGTAPMVVIYLIAKTSNVAIPGLYLVFGASVALGSLLMIKSNNVHRFNPIAP